MNSKSAGTDREPLPHSPEWEAICERCGRCCYEKYDYRGAIHYTRKACPYLDLHTKECRVYRQRRKYQPGCAGLTPALVHAGILPADCPYRQRIARCDDENI